MIEIRTLHEGEAEAFLALLCSVFEIEFNRTRDVFFREPFFDLDRKWGVFLNGKIIACLTTVPLLFGESRGIGIAGVATHPKFRAKGIASELLQTVLHHSQKMGESKTLLLAHQTNLYQKVGFKVLDEVISISLDQFGASSTFHEMDATQVRSLYDKWSSEHPLRLRRNAQRWRYWSWTYKPCYRQNDGYIVIENKRVAELLPQFSGVPKGTHTNWFGLRTMTEYLGIPCHQAKHEMFLMGTGFVDPPQFFLTDQF
jgi:N-acetylglutamate synthase-like GNAT family acetyltransferase